MDCFVFDGIIILMGGKIMPSRKDLQKSSEERLNAIKDLYKNKHYDIVCQDSGYVVELGLKAAVCKTLRKNVYPDNIKKYRTHNPDILVNLAKLRDSLNEKKKKNIKFFINWSLISKWSVNFRYEPIGRNKKENAEEVINAIENEEGGVYPWIKENW